MRRIRLSKYYTNSGCTNNKVLVFGIPGSGVETRFINHNTKSLCNIGVYQSYQEFEQRKCVTGFADIFKPEFNFFNFIHADASKIITEGFGCILLFSHDTNPFWQRFLFNHAVKADKPLSFYQPDISMPSEECIIFKHKSDGWHCYRDAKLKIKKAG